MLIRQHMYFIQLSGSDIDFERNVSGIFDAKKEVDHRKLKFSDGLGQTVRKPAKPDMRF